MKNILIAPGAFKNSLSAQVAAEAMAHGLRRCGLEAALHLLPIADGGNGTLDAFLAAGGEQVVLQVDDPLGRKVPSAYGLLPDGKTAVIEMALASGLELLKSDEMNALEASTYGTGQLMQAALERGARRFIVGMGGSATVDGGAGCMQALGVRLLDKNGDDLVRGGGALAYLHTVDTSLVDQRWHECEIVIATDVENPALGLEGAAAVFGPQKGASPADVITLENALSHYFSVIEQQLGKDVKRVSGGGAAGAFAAGLMAFLDGKIESGIDLLLAHNHFEDHLKDADLVITGEGQMDSQTIYGKGPIGVARLAKKYGVPTVAIVGGLNVDDEILHMAGIAAVLPIVNKPMLLEEAIANAAELVEMAALRLGYLLQLNE